MIGKLIRWLIVFPILGLALYLSYPFFLRGMGRYLVTEDRLRKADAIVVLAGDGGSPASSRLSGCTRTAMRPESS